MTNNERIHSCLNISKMAGNILAKTGVDFKSLSMHLQQ